MLENVRTCVPLCPSPPRPCRMYHLKLYTCVFLGSDAVSWMLTSGTVASRPEAIALCQRLYDAGYFHHVVRGPLPCVCMCVCVCVCTRARCV